MSRSKNKSAWLLAWGEMYKNAYPVSVFLDKEEVNRVVKAAGYTYNVDRDGWFHKEKQQYVRVLPVELGAASRI